MTMKGVSIQQFQASVHKLLQYAYAVRSVRNRAIL